MKKFLALALTTALALPLLGGVVTPKEAEAKSIGYVFNQKLSGKSNLFGSSVSLVKPKIGKTIAEAPSYSKEKLIPKPTDPKVKSR